MDNSLFRNNNYAGLLSFEYAGKTIAPNNSKDTASDCSVRAPSRVHIHSTATGSQESSSSNSGIDDLSLQHVVQGNIESQEASLSDSGIEDPSFVLVVQDTNESHGASTSDAGKDAPSFVLVVQDTNESHGASTSDAGKDAPSFVVVVQDSNESPESSSLLDCGIDSYSLPMLFNIPTNLLKLYSRFLIEILQLSYMLLLKPRRLFFTPLSLMKTLHYGIPFVTFVNSYLQTFLKKMLLLI